MTSPNTARRTVGSNLKHGLVQQKPPSMLKLIRYGKFKGKSDTRSQRCLHPSCNSKMVPNCSFCRALPYESSRLKSECRPPQFSHHQHPLPSNNRPGAGSLGYLVQPPNHAQCGSTIKIKASVRPLSLYRAREQMSRLASQLRLQYPSQVQHHVSTQTGQT